MLRGTWCTPKIAKVVEKGKCILKIHEVWHSQKINVSKDVLSNLQILGWRWGKKPVEDHLTCAPKKSCNNTLIVQRVRKKPSGIQTYIHESSTTIPGQTEFVLGKIRWKIEYTRRDFCVFTSRVLVPFGRSCHVSRHGFRDPNKVTPN